MNTTGPVPASSGPASSGPASAASASAASASAGPASRPAGRPRSQEADLAILTAALDLLIEVGAAQTSIEQVARRAGVTRATVYRRFAGKTELLVRALEWANHDRDPALTGWRDVDHLIGDMSAYLAVPRNRRLLRRIYGSVDDYPELIGAYRTVSGGRRAALVRETLCRARDLRRLPPEADVDVAQEILTAAVLAHVGTRPDDADAGEIRAYFLRILTQVGYR
ncbi:TetR/AcrR family transcriptional regulator [Nonomuraea jiangxiensis]|uniref:DNA-binding transcriptional regulator, AcrR family n=1 Tax=Nonomuraea jiangxiensis TaxID=633440 RepID=A0A1G8K2Q0_9ACTN|nr:TetR/AcrR family transcriptional regulator [Nonomuraea jiangxiensis]SDI37698.1 DNA-binding transcriptional regulator, AcrR family [Nonomuraea jiangxiensis]